MKENVAPEEDMSAEAEHDLLALYEEGILEEQDIEVPIPRYPLPAISINPAIISLEKDEDDSKPHPAEESPASLKDQDNRKYPRTPST